jgi:hypothetical protein
MCSSLWAQSADIKQSSAGWPQSNNWPNSAMIIGPHEIMFSDGKE